LGQFAFAEPAQITQAREDIEALQALLDDLDEQLSVAVEDYNYAVASLQETQAAAERTRLLLTQAESDLAVANAQLSDRLVEIYKEGQLGALETLLGVSSFSQLVNRLDWLQRMSGQDAKLVDDVESYRDEKTIRSEELAQQLEEEQALMVQAEAARETVEERLAANEIALADRKDELAQLIREEEERQARLAEEARKAAEEAARKAAEEAARKAAEEAERKAAEEAAARTTTTVKKTTTTTEKKTTTTEAEGTDTTTATTTIPVDAPDSATGAAVVEIALKYLGCPYVWAAEGPDSFDCSGLVRYVYKQVGITLPHSSRLQANYGTAVAKADLQPGDLIFFYNPIHHVAIYIGDGQMVHAAGTGKGVRIDYVSSHRSYNCARRIIN
jgi:cell wall-associated NlpC family hydrolase